MTEVSDLKEPIGGYMSSYTKTSYKESNKQIDRTCSSCSTTGEVK